MMELDLRYKNCPIPLIEVRKFINDNKNGDFKVILSDYASFVSIKDFLEDNRINYSSNKSNEDYVFEIIFDGNEKLSNKNFEIKNFSILIMNELFGEGEEELSITLMKSYFYALNNGMTFPSNIIFLNSAVKLLVGDNEITKSIESIKSRGVSILACGTCVDYYNLVDKIKIADIVNMYLISEILNNSDNVIRI